MNDTDPPQRRLMFMRGGMTVRREYRYFVYEGLAAVPYGLAYLVCGACLVVPALLLLGGTSLEQMRAAVLARPSLALIPMGPCCCSTGWGF